MEERERHNPVFARYPPESIEYKTELLNLLSHSDPKQLVFMVDRYESRERKEYIYLKAVGDNFLGTMILTIDNWDKLQGIKDHKGMGYSGAWILDLEYTVKKTSADIEFIYHNCKGIAD
jgi:hypothetical protein